MPVVHHDWYVDEQVSHPLPIFALSAAALRDEKIRDTRSELSGRHPIPTLAAVLDEFAGRMSLEVELKSPEPELPSAVATVLEPHRAFWATLEVTSSSASLLARIGQLCPEIRRAVLLGPTRSYLHDDAVGYEAVHIARRAGAHIVHVGLDQLNESVVGTIRAAGLDIHVYPVNEQNALERAVQFRVPEVVTDDPATLVRLRRASAVAEGRTESST